ncbi:MAG: CBS domain-containing protein [Steroidobacteraceae bacterium]
MLVENIMSRDVHCCRAEDTLAHAAELMWRHDCGALPVCDRGDSQKLIGIITDRDICMHAMFGGKALAELSVAGGMSKTVHCLRPSDSLAQAERVMCESRVRRLPVIDHGGMLLGMLSLADLAREAARERTQPRKDINETDVGHTLASICTAPRRSLAA